MIDIVYYKDPAGNFGDDLNNSMWQHALPHEVFGSDNLTLIGIGSLLNSEYLNKAIDTGRKVVVVGSGVAYGRLQHSYESVDFRAVRGPLSAYVLGRPEAAITDSAILLAWPKVSSALLPPPKPRTDVLFMPHHHSFKFGRWQAACERAGITFVDPRWRPDRILAAFGSAKLVIAEAMHAAIVADTLRIPWIPVISSDRIDKFKWSDWTFSLDLPYEPVELPSSSMNDRLARWIDRRSSGPDTSPDWRTFKNMPAAQVREHYNSRHKPAPAGNGQRSMFSQPVRDVAKGALSAFDELAIRRAAQALAKLATQSGFLSKDEVFSNRLDRLVETVDSLRAYA